jgi:hypothetical protein
MKAHKKNRGKPPPIILGTRWRWGVNCRPRRLTPEKNPGVYWIEGWVGSIAGLDGFGKEKFSWSLSGFEPRTAQPVASCYNDCAITKHEDERFDPIINMPPPAENIAFGFLLHRKVCEYDPPNDPHAFARSLKRSVERWLFCSGDSNIVQCARMLDKNCGLKLS